MTEKNNRRGGEHRGEVDDQSLDAVLPSALRLVGAAYEAAGHHPYWTRALILVLAGLVPDDATLSELLA